MLGKFDKSEDKIFFKWKFIFDLNFFEAWAVSSPIWIFSIVTRLAKQEETSFLASLLLWTFHSLWACIQSSLALTRHKGFNLKIKALRIVHFLRKLISIFEQNFYFQRGNIKFSKKIWPNLNSCTGLQVLSNYSIRIVCPSVQE